MQAAILAGGEGKRMRGVSSLPKPMLPLGGKPILERLVGWLKKSGFDDVFLCLGYRPDAFRDHFGDGSKWGVRLDYRVESSPRGTAGAIKDLGDDVKGDLLVVYGDLFVDMDCGPLLDFHAAHDGIATLVVRKTDHPEDSDLARVEEDGRISFVGRGVVKKGEALPAGMLGCTAMWVIRRRLLDRIPADEPSDFARNVFPGLVAAKEKLMAFRLRGEIADVGTPARYEAYRKRLGS